MTPRDVLEKVARAENKKNSKKESFGSKVKRVGKGVGLGLLSAGITGGAILASDRQARQAVGRAAKGAVGKWREGRRMKKVLGVNLGKLKTKSEFKKAWQSAARKHHPDVGGSTDTMQQVNKAFQDMKSSGAYEKLSMAYWPMLASTLTR